MTLATSHLWMTSGCPRRPYWNIWIPRTEGSVLLLIFMYVRWLVDKLPAPPPRLCLQDVAEDQSGRRESRLTPSQSGCISVAPPALPFPHLVASPVRMMSLTAVNTVSMETPTTALAYISGSSPSILQHHHPPPSHIPHSASPPCHPAFSPLI